MTAPSATLSATIAAFSCADHLRRRSTPVITSIRRGCEVADTSLVSSLRSTLWSKRCLLMGRYHARRLRPPERGGRAPLTIEQQFAPILRAFAGAVGEADEFLAALRRRADQHQNALLLVFKPGLQIDAVCPDVHVAFRRQIALLPSLVLVEPAVLEANDGGWRQPRRVLAQQGRKRFGEIAGRDALQVEDRQQRLDRLRAPQVGRQDRRCKANAAGIASRSLAIAHTGLADRDRADTCQHHALRQMAVAHNALAAVLALEISMLGEKIRDLGLDRLRQQPASPLPQDFGELIVKGSWLNQFEHVIVGHGISLLRWRSGVVKQPHDMPPFRFLPSPTFGDNSISLSPTF